MHNAMVSYGYFLSVYVSHIQQPSSSLDLPACRLEPVSYCDTLLSDLKSMILKTTWLCLGFMPACSSSKAEACLVPAAARVMLIQLWTGSLLTGSMAPGVTTTALIKPTAAMKPSSQPNTGQEAAGAMMLKKHHLQLVTTAEGTDAAMKRVSIRMVTEVVIEETGTAPGEKRRDVPAAGGTGMRNGIWRWMRMLTGTGVPLGKSVMEEIKLIGATGNAMLVSISGFSLSET